MKINLVPEAASYDGMNVAKIGKQLFRCDDIVVVGGHIGNIEGVDFDEEICHLGLSYEYVHCMANPEDWEMWSGYSCPYEGIRFATEEEKKNYEISAGLTCDAAEAADRAWKERWEKW